MQIWMTREDCRQQLAVSAADVQHLGMETKVVASRPRRVGSGANRNHPLLEERCLDRMIREPIKTWFPEHSLKHGLARANAIGEALECEICFAIDHSEEVPRAGRLVGTQGAADLGQGEPT